MCNGGFAICEYYAGRFAKCELRWKGGIGSGNFLSVQVISKNAWRHAVAADHTLEGPVIDWYKVARNASWGSLVEVRKVYPHADFVAPYTAFNLKGNAYRLIVKIEYRWQMIFVKHLLTHLEYNKGDWMK
jgi:mRNA interferase HigB